LAPPSIISASSSEATTPLATIGSDTSSAITRDFQTPKKDTTPLLAPLNVTTDTQASSGTPTGPSTHGFLNIFKQSPSSDGEGRKPNKLQKKRIPGSALSSAHSSTSGQQLYLAFQPTLLDTLTMWHLVNNLSTQLRRRHRSMLRPNECLPMQP
jgi:hypothetical protein